ncbi:integral membrane sensor signal transduction histidine kinase [Ruminiclostridium papyrosolvens DSM 2782]|uniref:histidine kinase n=1 Tax=Ruminiclostridium papyrosolvens DSM 2782 TaxID=588581 RepID=F1T7Q4_9FIRM|nr:HAMP domain-containing sensor histidine kinase [Ruminiclostridium papyrosolvens]EGD49502.1 integral membrane sensor signal transduction histidine kinase [Ruminiclostridium papyrosolvens DSM 2782]WES33373.1 HAMP domain-containing sensor histidine kinase [Ruminiclostridium papyrosolvens DSM 2782]
MKISLKTKLFGAFFGLIVFSVVLTWVLNSTLLQKYYYHNQRNTMRQSYNIIKDAYNNDSDNIMMDIEKIESLRGTAILLFDKDLNVIYQSRQRNLQMLRENRHIMGTAPSIDRKFIKDKISRLQTDTPKIEIRYDKRMESNFVSLYAKIDDNIYIYMGTPFAAIQESSQIAISFSILTGLLTLVLGGLIIYILTSRVTKPIVKLNVIAKKMAVLDFSEKYYVNRNDEIGTLGESINSLSKQLESSIRDLQQANLKLMQDIQKERQIDEMRKEFISNVSHELKTPIAIVQGYAEGLRLNVNDDEENKNFYCDVIIDEANKMDSMVRKLLELSELEFNQISLERDNFPINELITDVLKKKAILFAEKDAKVTFNSKGKDNVIVNADYYYIEQVFMNYLSNALNHMDDKKIINVDLEITDTKARVEVFNSGKNIPDEVIESIWMSFFKVDKARTRAYGGTGLGLSIVKAIQKAHNNAYGVINKAEGVMFWFETDLA